MTMQPYTWSTKKLEFQNGTLADTVQKNYSYMNLVIQIEIKACQSDIHDLPLIPVMGMITKSTKCVCP